MATYRPAVDAQILETNMVWTSGLLHRQEESISLSEAILITIDWYNLSVEKE
jgi:hypothetical protein